MPTTPRGLPYPVLTESNDPPQDIKELAEAVDGALDQAAAATQAKRGWSISTTAQDVGPGALSVVGFNTLSINTDNYRPGTGPVTIPAGLGGFYTVTAQAKASTALSGRSFLEVLHTSGASTTTYRASIAAGEDSGTVTATIHVAPGDTLTMQIYHGTPGTVVRLSAIFTGARITV